MLNEQLIQLMEGDTSVDRDSVMIVYTATVTTLAETTLGGALNANSKAITNVNVDSRAIDGTLIGANSAAAATFTTATINTSLLPDTSGGATIGSATQEFSHIYHADNSYMYFGNDQDITLLHVHKERLLFNTIQVGQPNAPARLAVAVSVVIMRSQFCMIAADSMKSQVSLSTKKGIKWVKYV